MEPHQPCVAATFALPMATMTSCPGTWKTSWGRLYPTVTGLRTEECPPSGKVSTIQAPIHDPVVGECSSTGSTSHDWRLWLKLLSWRRLLRNFLLKIRTMVCMLRWGATWWCVRQQHATPCSTCTTPMWIMWTHEGPQRRAHHPRPHKHPSPLWQERSQQQTGNPAEQQRKRHIWIHSKILLRVSGSEVRP